MVKNIIKQLRSNNVKFIDLRVSNLDGKIHHFTYNAAALDELDFSTGVKVCGKRLLGQHCEQQLLLKPDLTTMFIDPFTVETTAVFICNMVDIESINPCDLDSRNIAQQAVAYLAESGIAEQLEIGIDVTFCLFDDVRYANTNNASYYFLDAEGLPANSGRQYEAGNLGYRSRDVQSSYAQIAPMDDTHDLRSEICGVLEQIGIHTVSHYHGAAANQCGIVLKPTSLLAAADNLQKFKYVVHNVARSYNKSATFMPQPLLGDTGSYMHIQQSLCTPNKMMHMRGKREGKCTEQYLHYISGLLQHIQVLNAFSNPTTNSYKRKIEHHYLYLDNHCSASSVEKPLSSSRIVAKYPDPMGNPYLLFASMLVMGIHGIHNKVDLVPTHQHGRISSPDTKIAQSLPEALRALDRNRALLYVNNIFNDKLIDQYIQLKTKEIELIEQAPTPAEFALYYGQ